MDESRCADAPQQHQEFMKWHNQQLQPHPMNQYQQQQTKEYVGSGRYRRDLGLGDDGFPEETTADQKKNLRRKVPGRKLFMAILALVTDVTAKRASAHKVGLRSTKTLLKPTS